MAVETAGSRSSAETPERAPEKQNHSASLREGGGREEGEPGAGRRDKRRRGAGEGDEVTGGRHLSRRAQSPSPGCPQASAGRAAWGAARWRSALLALRKPRGGGRTLRHLRGQRRGFWRRNLQNASAEGPPVQSSRPGMVYPLSPLFTPSFTPNSGSALSNPHPFLAWYPANCRIGESQQENRKDR